MQTLRNAHLIARFVLVWFALSIGVAIASPIVKPQGMEVICTGTAGVMKLMLKTDDGSDRDASRNTLDCPLCGLLGAAPPPLASPVKLAPAQALAHATQSIPAARIAALTTAPLPARGPPTASFAI